MRGSREAIRRPQPRPRGTVIRGALSAGAAASILAAAMMVAGVPASAGRIATAPSGSVARAGGANARTAARLAASRFLLGLSAGEGSARELSDIRRVATLVRVSKPVTTARWERAGVKVIADEAGPYTRSGVSGLDHQAYVLKVVALVRRNPHLFAVEVLNEPGGDWFWGAQSESSTNRQSYARLLIEVHEALVANFGAARPLELGSWDGGHDSSNAWGEAWSRNAAALADVDGVTNHPYGGTGARAGAILGNRSLVAADERVSHKPIYITEVGFPTAGPTSDSLRYTEAEQASAMYSFGVWAQRTGYVAGVTFFSYHDEQDGGGYGVETHRGVKKQAFAALERLHRRGLAGSRR